MSSVVDLCHHPVRTRPPPGGRRWGVSKFLTYRRSVDFYSVIGIPAAEASVIVVGIVVSMAAGRLLSNRFPRLAAVLAVPYVTVAATTAGHTWQNIGLLVMALDIIDIETNVGTGDVDGSTG